MRMRFGGIAVRVLDHGQRWRIRRFGDTTAVRGPALGLLAAGAFLWPLAGLAQAAPPTNTAPPSVQGTAQEGQTLSYSPGTWSVPSGTTITSQWQQCSPTCKDIPGTADQASYALGPGDVGDTIRVLETAINSTFPDVQVSSNVLGPITAPSTTSLTVSPQAPVTDQTVTVVATVTSDAGSAPPSGSLTFVANGTPIVGCSGLGVASTGQSVTMTCQTAFSASTVSLTAAFNAAPGTFVIASTSPATTVVIGKAPSSTSLDAPARVDAGSKATYIATVTAPSSGGPVQPVGYGHVPGRGQAHRRLPRPGSGGPDGELHGAVHACRQAPGRGGIRGATGTSRDPARRPTA